MNMILAFSEGSFAAIVAIIIIVLVILASCIRVVPQATAMVIERLGGYIGTWSVGLHVKLPIVDRVADRKSVV